MLVLKPGYTLPMHQYLPLMNQRLGVSLYDRMASGKSSWKDQDNWDDLGTYGGDTKYPGGYSGSGKKKPGKMPISDEMKDQVMQMMNDIQEQEQPTFIEMIATDPTFPYVLPIIIMVSLAVILVPLTGWLFTGFLTDNFAYLDGKDASRFNVTHLQAIFTQNWSRLIETLDRVVPAPSSPAFQESSIHSTNQTFYKLCAL